MFTLLKKFPVNALPPVGGLSAWSYVLQRFMPALRRRAAADGALEHLGSLALTAQSSLALVRWRDRTLLLGVTPQGISLLTQSVEPNKLSPGFSANEKNS